MLKIEFKVFEEHLKIMKEMSLEDFEYEFSSIYGNYCMVIKDKSYPFTFPMN